MKGHRHSRLGHPLYSKWCSPVQGMKCSNPTFSQHPNPPFASTISTAKAFPSIIASGWRCKSVQRPRSVRAQSPVGHRRAQRTQTLLPWLHIARAREGAKLARVERTSGRRRRWGRFIFPCPSCFLFGPTWARFIFPWPSCFLFGPTWARFIFPWPSCFCSCAGFVRPLVGLAICRLVPVPSYKGCDCSQRSHTCQSSKASSARQRRNHSQ